MYCILNDTKIAIFSSKRTEKLGVAINCNTDEQGKWSKIERYNKNFLFSIGSKKVNVSKIISEGIYYLLSLFS